MMGRPSKVDAEAFRPKSAVSFLHIGENRIWAAGSELIGFGRPSPLGDPRSFRRLERCVVDGVEGPAPPFATVAVGPGLAGTSSLCALTPDGTPFCCLPGDWRQWAPAPVRDVLAGDFARQMCPLAVLVDGTVFCLPTAQRLGGPTGVFAASLHPIDEAVISG
jgi:hypothetical protein